MAVRINAAGDFLARTSDFPQVDAIAVSMWFYMDTDRNAATAQGQWVYRFEGLDGSSNPLASAEGTFFVRPSARY